MPLLTFNGLKPEQSWRHTADTFQSVCFFNENTLFLFKVWLNFNQSGPIVDVNIGLGDD